MSEQDRWLLPEGIEETLPDRAERLERLRRALLDLFHSWGYELVMPPFIDYLESLLTGTGKDLDLQTFKLTDQLTGRMMGVRADMTPQVARIDAHHLHREGPVRLCYLGTVLLTRPDGIARSRSPLQVGAELYGYADIASDVEVLQLMLEALAVTGVTKVHIDLGHVGIYRGLVQQAGLSGAQETALFDALQRKAKPEIAALLAEIQLESKVREMLIGLVDLNGDLDVLSAARDAFKAGSAAVHAALDNLEAIAGALARRIPSVPLYFDLAELRGYTYHTGAVFAAYVPGHGQSVALGGRYDDIGRVFGRARPATGFSMDLKTLLLIGGQAHAPMSGILAPATEDPALHDTVRALRQRGERVVCALPEQIGGAQAMRCDRELVYRDGSWIVANVSD